VLAGYKLPGGSLLGDPSEVEFTTMAIEVFGWSPPDPRTRFDVLCARVLARPNTHALFCARRARLFDCAL
jgi:hypothetical protein